MRFLYSVQSWNVEREAHTELSVSGPLDGVLWSNKIYYNESRQINRDLIENVRQLLDCKESMDQHHFVKFLLTIGEAETGGGNGKKIIEKLKLKKN